MKHQLPLGVAPIQDGYKITAREIGERVCEQHVKMQSPRLPLFRAAADGVIALLAYDAPDVRWNDADLPLTKPTVVLIGDDPEPDRPSLGPTGWVCARGAKYWGRAAILHGGAGKPEHYHEAIAGALIIGRMVFVETASRHATAWRDFLHGQMGTLTIMPEHGAHPVIPTKAQMQ